MAVGYYATRASGAPVDLFEFIYGEGAGDRFTYTDAEEKVSHGGLVYEPIAISRTAVKSGSRTKEGSELKVTVPASSEIAKMFQGISPRRVIFLRVYQGYIARASDYEALAATATPGLTWSGRVLERTRKKQTVELSCDTLGAGMKRPGLTKTYSRECQHVLYGPRCQADKTAASSSATVVSSSGVTLELGSGWNGANGPVDYLGGMVEWDGEFGLESRMIVNVSADAVILDGPAPDLSAGSTVTVVLGCPRSMRACEQLHNNILNFGGCAFIPLDNPINKNNHT